MNSDEEILISEIIDEVQNIFQELPTKLSISTLSLLLCSFFYTYARHCKIDDEKSKFELIELVSNHYIQFVSRTRKTYPEDAHE